MIIELMAAAIKKNGNGIKPHVSDGGGSDSYDGFSAVAGMLLGLLAGLVLWLFAGLVYFLMD